MALKVFDTAASSLKLNLPPRARAEDDEFVVGTQSRDQVLREATIPQAPEETTIETTAPEADMIGSSIPFCKESKA
jgi:hypothetical protein